jgi:hypothetical protein
MTATTPGMSPPMDFAGVQNAVQRPPHLAPRSFHAHGAPQPGWHLHLHALRPIRGRGLIRGDCQCGCGASLFRKSTIIPLFGETRVVIGLSD